MTATDKVAAAAAAAAAKSLNACDTCGKPTKNSCGRCKTTYFCTKTCQTKSWKNHKLFCFAPGSVCTRCQEVIVPGSMCKVPHPDHMQNGAGSSFGGSVCLSSYFFQCQACGENYTRSSNVVGVKITDMPVTDGEEWCYQGQHTVKPIPEGDDRRVCKDVVVLCTGPELQEQIEDLDGNESVRVLKLKTGSGMYEEEPYELAGVHLPNLEELQTLDVNMSTIELTPDLTPKLRKLKMQNPSESSEPDFIIECAELEEISIYYWGPGDYDWVQTMLDHATKLVSFDSYKLRVGYLKFASNKLKTIRLQRAELLCRLDLWAPTLVNLNVQAAYDLSQVFFLKEHPLQSEMDEGERHFFYPLRVNATNACLGVQAVASIKTHPRVNVAQFESTVESDFIW